jgi:GTP cyclohydrolase II
MPSKTTIAVDGATLIARAEALVPLLRKLAGEAEALGKLPDAEIEAFREAGFFTAMRPTETGGSAIDFRTFIDIVRTLSRGDASAGWVGAFLISHDWLLSRLGAEAQAEVFSNGPGLAAAVAAPPGKAEPVDGGYRVTGRWRFASAVLHANWIIVSAVGPTGPLAVVAKVTEGDIIDTWQVPGMKATGSNDFALDDVFIPAHRVTDFIQYSSRENDGAAIYPSYEILQYPMYRVLSLIHGAVAVGTAEGALEIFPDAMAKRIRPQSGARFLEEPEAHAAYGEAAQLALIARLLLDDAVNRTERLYAIGTPEPSMDERAKLNLDVAASGVEAFKAVDAIVQVAGASVLRDGTDYDRIARNTLVMRNHTTLDWRHAQLLAGRVLLGFGLGEHGDAVY